MVNITVALPRSVRSYTNTRCSTRDQLNACRDCSIDDELVDDIVTSPTHIAVLTFTYIVVVATK
jgi:hypothetical protein